MAPGELMRAEIAEQPAVLRRLVDGAAEIGALSAVLRRARPRFVLLAGRGSSGHAALYGKYLAEVLLGLPAGLVSPSTTTVYDVRPDLRDVLYVAVSQSGTSPDLVEAVAAARDGGATTVAVTNAGDSPLAQAAEHVVDVLAGAEVSVAATKTYTAQLLALHLLLLPLAGLDAARDAARLPDAAEATLRGEVGPAVERCRRVEVLLTTGRGLSYGTAREAALKLMETSYVMAQAFSGAELLHGPLALVEPGFPVVAVVSSGAAGRALEPVLDRLAERGADVLTVGSGDADLPVHSAGVAAALHPVLDVLPLQQLACALAVERGQDPDVPRGLAKQTRTR